MLRAVRDCMSARRRASRRGFEARPVYGPVLLQGRSAPRPLRWIGLLAALTIFCLAVPAAATPTLALLPAAGASEHPIPDAIEQALNQYLRDTASLLGNQAAWGDGLSQWLDEAPQKVAHSCRGRTRCLARYARALPTKELVAATVSIQQKHAVIEFAAVSTKNGALIRAHTLKASRSAAPKQLASVIDNAFNGIFGMPHPKAHQDLEALPLAQLKSGPDDLDLAPLPPKAQKGAAGSDAAHDNADGTAGDAATPASGADGTTATSAGSTWQVYSGLGAGGAGAATLIAGAALAIQARSTYRRAEPKEVSQLQAHALQQQGDRQVSQAWLLSGVGGGLLAVGGTLLFMQWLDGAPLPFVSASPDGGAQAHIAVTW